MPKVNSTAIEKVRITGPNKFRVRFHEGGEYEITAPRSVFHALRTSRSVGQTFNYSVRGLYPTRYIRNSKNN